MAGSTQSEIPSQLGRTAVVTGATGGLGYETALALAKAGSEVILTGRDDQRGRSAVEKISREVTGGGFGELRGAPARALIMPQARDASAAARLWDVSEQLTSTSFE